MSIDDALVMILAGGEGKRLFPLTQDRAKPAVPFGGRYRIIDFVLNNFINSGFFKIKVLTQYKSDSLNKHISKGWALSPFLNQYVDLVPAQMRTGGAWYQGTADAVYQNAFHIHDEEPDYVCVFGGDHIYKMDYSDMLTYHKEKNADCTIAMLEVPWEEASRFGLMFVDDDGAITAFEEKPKNPKSNKASMGVYMFTWKKLRQYLLDDEANPNSSNDFGHDLIPAMHEAGERLFAYPFDGYWKDVGTIDSLWEANLDLLNPKVDLDLSDPSWKIYSRTPTAPPHYVSPDATVQNSMVTEGCEISGDVDFSVIFADVTIEKGAVIRDSIIMPGTVIKSGAVVQYAIVAENAVVEENAVVGERPEAMEDLDKWGVAVIGKGVTVKKGMKIEPKAMYDGEKEDVRK